MKEQQKRKIQQFHHEIEDGTDLRRWLTCLHEGEAWYRERRLQDDWSYFRRQRMRRLGEACHTLVVAWNLWMFIRNILRPCFNKSEHMYKNNMEEKAQMAVYLSCPATYSSYMSSNMGLILWAAQIANFVWLSRVMIFYGRPLSQIYVTRPCSSHMRANMRNAPV